MAATRLADVIVPEVFAPYTVQRSAELSVLVQSGLLTTNSTLQGMINGGGSTFNLPFFNDLTGADELIEDGGSGLTVNNITTDQQIGVALARAKAWGSSFLAQYVSGEDPMAVIGDLVAQYWVRREQDTVLSILSGLFGTGGPLNGGTFGGVTYNHVNAQGTTAIDNNMLIDTVKLLGDSYGKVSTIVCHSHVYHALRKLDLVQYVQEPSGLNLQQPTYMGMRVLVDDGVPNGASSYTTFVFAPGAIMYANANIDSSDAVEVDRDSLRHEDVLINRKRCIYHPSGFKWSGTAAGATPTNAELGAAAAFQPVYEPKNIPMVALTSGV
jgi:hypothetical protein